MELPFRSLGARGAYGLFALVAACSSGAVEPDPGVGAIDERVTHDSAAPADASPAADARSVDMSRDAATSAPPEACDGGRLSGEFLECEHVEEYDAAPEPMPDAEVPDGSEEVDASSPEPLCPDDLPFDCSRELMHPITTGATCTFAPNSFEMRFDACEDCGTARTTYQVHMFMRECNSCTFRFGDGGDTQSLSGGACTQVRFRTTTDQFWGDPCVDVWAATNSTIRDDFSGAQYRGPQVAHICRCDLAARTCRSCDQGGCEDTP